MIFVVVVVKSVAILFGQELCVCFVVVWTMRSFCCYGSVRGRYCTIMTGWVNNVRSSNSIAIHSKAGQNAFHLARCDTESSAVITRIRLGWVP